MIRTLALIASAAFATAAPLAAPPATVSAQTGGLASLKTCRNGLQATTIAGTPNAVTVGLRSVPDPGATITAYGATTQWSAPIGPYATASLGRSDEKEYSFVVRADGPIEAVLYHRSNPACTTHAAVRERDSDEDGPEVQRPTLALGDPKPLEPIYCAQRYVPATTLFAARPATPPIAQIAGISGVVLVLVSVDEFGKPTRAVIDSSPSSVLNKASIDAALQSTFRPEIFRCHTVPGDYIFSVFYSAR
ncbi:MAG TPA: energy transducer TonB [Candidatus Limnocylindrales bacterium]|nr:energy transducer TonB [Candidatus Limnocylindrales bacterium]